MSRSKRKKKRPLAPPTKPRKYPKQPKHHFVRADGSIIPFPAQRAGREAFEKGTQRHTGQLVDMTRGVVAEMEAMAQKPAPTFMGVPITFFETMGNPPGAKDIV